ncbi:M16 family metallopeptidase [Vulcanisaeta souniana]|uniref:Peptidase M16 n=1 Tax=Vulcanisaeta souniana JCM 11219 TaxID=1293586 RepID=A0A830E015_9CREN|nr:pitrilysin family protein [Vulcanisaeta souniana]BDR91935.1 peptidase M16 [Vulcanisaeta souniana JCM 11219]GGI69220.1 peptidase M16 [Vulcanisaeta souniana JCM 11219]
MEYHVLDNGLRLIMNRTEAPTVGIAVGVGIGSIYEDKNMRGISHFAEHVVYRAHPNIDLEIEGLGGVSDAYTERTLTMYLFEIIPSELENLLRLIYRLLSNRKIDSEDLEKERQVILSEIKMRNDDPGTLIYDLGPKSLFGDSDYGDPVIGTDESVSSIMVKDLMDFLESYYTPDNTVISIWGPIGMPTNKITEIFSGWSGKSKRKKTPTMGRGAPIVIRKSVDSAYLSYSWYRYFNNQDPYMAMVKSSLLDFHLVSGLSSYLLSRFRKGGLTYAIDADRDFLPNAYYYQIVISAINEKSIDMVKEELTNALLNINEIFNDEDYLRKRLRYFRYLMSDYMRRPLQIAESMTYMELKLGKHNIEEFNKSLETNFKMPLDDLLSNGIWSLIIPE